MSEEISSKNHNWADIRSANGRLVDLEGSAAGLLVEVSTILRNPEYSKEDLDRLIDILDQVRVLLIAINKLRKILR